MTNLLMDLALAFFIFCRWRVSALSMALAVVFAGLVTPIFIMACYHATWEVFASFIDRHGVDPYTRVKVHHALHYGSQVILSATVAWATLVVLDARWARALARPRVDPVFLR
jgi:hypothetical protein